MARSFETLILRSQTADSSRHCQLTSLTLDNSLQRLALRLSPCTSEHPALSSSSPSPPPPGANSFSHRWRNSLLNQSLAQSSLDQTSWI